MRVSSWRRPCCCSRVRPGGRPARCYRAVHQPGLPRPARRPIPSWKSYPVTDGVVALPTRSISGTIWAGRTRPPPTNIRCASRPMRRTCRRVLGLPPQMVIGGIGDVVGSRRDDALAMMPRMPPRRRLGRDRDGERHSRWWSRSPESQRLLASRRRSPSPACSRSASISVAARTPGRSIVYSTCANSPLVSLARRGAGGWRSRWRDRPTSADRIAVFVQRNGQGPVLGAAIINLAHAEAAAPQPPAAYCRSKNAPGSSIRPACPCAAPGSGSPRCAKKRSWLTKKQVTSTTPAAPPAPPVRRCRDGWSARPERRSSAASGAA